MKRQPFSNETELQKDETDAMRALRSTFMEGSGLYSLAWILQRCRFFDRIESEEDRARYNFAVELLESMGIYQMHNLYQFAQKLSELQPYEQEEE